MKNKKIFFVADARSIHTAKWVDYFVEKDYTVYLATFASANNTKCTNIYYLGNKESHVSGGNYHYLFGVHKLSEHFRNIQPDTINAHYSYSMGFIALLAKKFSRITSEFSVVCHGSDVLDPPMPYIFNQINKYILRRCDKVFAVSDQIKDKIEKFGLDVEKIFVGQYGIALSSLAIEKDIDIISNRTYTPNSRIDFLLEAINEMEYENLNIVFVLPNIEDEEYEDLKNKYPYIVFYKHIEYSKMINLVSRAKVYISATQSDGTSLSLLEAMQVGCMPLVSNIVSNRSWVLDMVNGYLFDGNSEFKDKLKIILKLKDPAFIIATNKRLLLENGNYLRQMKKIEKFLIGNI